MSKGHIRLGADINDFRDYLLVNDAKIRQRILANPMAAKLGQGAGKYDDLTNWSGWVMENWQAGLGKREADAEGFLYAELETRFQGQLTLPLWYANTAIPEGMAGPLTAFESNPAGIDDVLTLAASGAVRKLAMKITHSTAGTTGVNLGYILLSGSGSTVTVGIYTDSAGQPGTLLGIGAIATSQDMGFDYYRFIPTGNSPNFTNGSTYWIVVGTSDTAYVPVYDNGAGSANRLQYNGSTWAQSNYSFFYYLQTSGATHYAGASAACIWNNAPYFSSGSSLYYLSAGVITRATAGLTTASSFIHAFGDRLYIANGSSDQQYWNGSALTTDTGNKANIYCSWNGYLWRGYQNDVYYTADGTTWTGPIQIGPDGYTVNGLAGLGEDVYAATDEGLYKIGAGDLVSGVMRFNNISSTNGLGMINHQGALFIPTYSDLLRYGGAEIMSVNPSKDEGMPLLKQGRVLSLGTHNYWLFAIVATNLTEQDNAWPVIVAYNDQGWHYIGKMYQRDLDFSDYGFGQQSANILWDTANDALWVVGTYVVYKYTLPIDNPNPYKDNSGNVKYFPGGFMETPWFYSGLKEIRKDCESVYVTGENISSHRPVKIYWKDDDSTDWEYLGVVTSNRQELRWSDPDTRPNTRQIKLGIVMMSDDYTETPRVDAIRLKFQNMVTDRWRWQLSINVSDNQEMLDSDLNIYTKEQQRTHLDTLIRSVGPVLFEDVDGVQYEVKVLGASEQVERYEFIESAPNFTSVYSLTVEQATTTSYN